MRPSEDDFGIAIPVRGRARHSDDLDDDSDTRLSLRVSTGATAACPLCGSTGEATNLFKGVFMCLADPCAVWTFEADAASGEA